MRDIKFRAWDNVKDEMYYVGEEDSIVFAFNSEGIVATDITEGEKEFKTLHHLQYMQFTGLQDKNGKGIYAGDILIELYEREMFKQSVYYDGGAFMVKQLSSPESDYLLNGCDLEMTEVIGNIYENPQLLEK